MSSGIVCKSNFDVTACFCAVCAVCGICFGNVPCERTPPAEPVPFAEAELDMASRKRKADVRLGFIGRRCKDEPAGFLRLFFLAQGTQSASIVPP